MRIVRHPVLCNYYLTYRCNATCSFCDIWEKPSPFIHLSDVRDNLRDLKKLGVRVIDFTGGEPLLHPDLPVFLQEAKKMGFITTVTTNGLRYPRMAEALAGQIDMLHFSLDYADAENHNRVRGARCFEAVMASVEKAKALGERPDILFTVTENNLNHIKPVWENICLPNRLVLILNPVFEYNKVGSGLPAEALASLRSWGKKRLVYLNEAFLDLREDGGNKRDKPVCRAGSTTIVISPENKLMLPCYHLGIKEIPVEGKLYELYGSDEVRKLIALEGRMPACEGCVINCYMQPSFSVELSRYWFKALPSTLKYSMMKGTWKELF